MIVSAKRRSLTRRRPKPPRQSLRFSPYAWAKLIYMRDLGDTEIGAFGISDATDLLLVTDIVLVDQVCTPVTVQFIDESVADFFDDQYDAGRQPERFSRIWLHTHPGGCPRPSHTDEQTFRRCFAVTDWAVMFILAQSGACYGRLRFNTGPGSDVELQPQIDYSLPFPAADHDPWYAEYEQRVRVLDPFTDGLDAARRPLRHRHDSLTVAADEADDASWEASEWTIS